MKLVTSNSGGLPRHRSAWIRVCLVVAMCVVAMAGLQTAMGQKLTIAAPEPGEPSPEAQAAEARVAQIDETPVTTDDWGTLPREAVWDKDGSIMVLIPSGEFTMGLDNPVDKGGRIQEGPAHKVYLSSYYMDKYEVTNRQYYAFCKATGHIRPRVTEGRGLSDPERPVVGVTWEDALRYAEWAGKDLPTEAQWEKAATSDTLAKFPWGNEWKTGAANTKETGLGTTAPPESYPLDRSSYGIYDMAGNVSEWILDWYDRDYYKKSARENPTGPTEGVFSRVIRGGDFYYDKEYARLTSRRFRPTNQAREECGFRCVKNLKIEPTPTPSEAMSHYMPPTPTPVANPFEAVEAELYKSWQSGQSLPITLSPLNIGRQAAVTLINGLPLDISVSIVNDTPRIVVFDQAIPALQRKEIRLGIDTTMGLYVRIPKLDRILRVDPVFQSNARPFMMLTPSMVFPAVTDPSGVLRPPQEKPELTVYFDNPKLPWNVVQFYNDSPTTVSLKFPKRPLTGSDAAPDQPFVVSIGSRAVWEASMAPGIHTFDTFYLGTFPSGAATQRLEINDRFDLRGVVIQENIRTNERIRVFAKMLPPLESIVLQEASGPYGRK